MLLKSCRSNFEFLLPVTLTHTLDPKTLIKLRSGSSSHHASYGVMLIVLCHLLFNRYTAWTAAADQYFAGRLAPYNRVRTVVPISSLYRSTWPFWEGLSAPVGSTLYWKSLSIAVRHPVDRANSPPWSHLIRPPFSLPNSLRNNLVSSIGGSFVLVRKIQAYFDISSTTSRYDVYPSYDSTTLSDLAVFLLKSSFDALINPKSM